MSSPLSFDLISIVWGESYLDIFLDILIPNYLSKNNIPSCSKLFHLISFIYTTSSGKEKILQHPSYLQLKKLIPVEILPVIDENSIKTANKYSVKGYCQSLAIKHAISRKTALLLLNPDSLISDGGLLRCCSLIGEGKKAVLVAELARTEIEAVVPDLQKNYFDAAKHCLTLPNRDLVELGIQNLHAIGRILFWERTPFTQWPSALYWTAGERGLLAKFFHLHPLAIDLREIHKSLPDILMPDDGGLLEYLGIAHRDVYPVTNSDEIACVELSSRYMDPLGSIPSQDSNKTLSLIKWALQATLISHRKNFSKLNFRFQSHEEINWKALERRVFLSTFWSQFVFHMINLCCRERWKPTAKKLGLLWLKRKIFRPKTMSDEITA